MKKKLIFILFTSFSNLFYAQSKFTIFVNSIIYNNKTLTFYPILLNQQDSSYIKLKLKLNRNKINLNNGKFILKGNISDYPEPIEMCYLDKKTNYTYYAALFFDNKNANYLVKIPDLSKSKYKYIDISNSKSQNEYNYILKNLQNNKIDLMPFDSNNLAKKNEFLNHYISKNPNSFVALWMIISDYRYIGYNNEFSKNLDLFGAIVKNSILYKSLIKSIDKDLSLGEGKQFPHLKFQNEEIYNSFGKKYTLIDFWFSYCPPCLEQVPTYKKLYSKYKNQGFQIISLSTDRSQDIDNWKKVIKAKDLNWKQFLDENGKESRNYNISGFPTTFLLNSDGKILQRNISSEDLEKFLEANLKN